MATSYFSIQAKIQIFIAILGLISTGHSLHADSFQKNASNNGWSDPWLSQNGASGTTIFHVFTPSDTDYAPLNNSGDYLQMNYLRTGEAGNTRAGIAQELDIITGTSIDLNKPYEIHFDFRLDELTGFSTSTDQILFSTENETTIRDSKEAAPWYLWIRGDDGFSVQNGNGTGDGKRVQLSTLGLAVETGTVYSVSVYLTPETFSYDLTISDGTTTYRASDANAGNPLGFRTNTIAHEANIFQARMMTYEVDDHFKISLDNVSVIQTR